ncbi:unnamed protein product [Paramecium primaurelia]|uniref:Ubiquitin-like protease family profile domain-containing protein n=1 Tax=Paramecium primaurelia TaxID=5886 RepID=A0A8S1NNV6_PARPR|nr:unnamed protein product [Paramecium primaurelia]
MQQLRQPIVNKTLNIACEQLQIRSNYQVIFHYPNINTQKDNQCVDEYQEIINLTHQFNKLSEKLFWGNQSDTIDIIIFNQQIDDNPKQAFKMLGVNHVISYYHNVKLLFPQYFFNHIKMVLISPKNNIIYDFKNKKIISTFNSPYIKNFLSIFIKEQNIKDQFEVENVNDLFLNQFVKISKKKQFQNQKHQTSVCKIVDDKQTIIWPIDNKGINYYLCFEPNFIIYYGQLNENYQKHGRGIFFQTIWNDCNPNYTILQGNFQNGKKNGIMLKFSSRSQNLFQGHEYKDDEFIKQVDLDDNGKIKVVEIVKPNEIQDKPTQTAPKRRIIIMEEGVIINTNTQQVQSKAIKSDIFVKYNQQFNSNDEKILSSSRYWLNSSMIDGYVLALQKQQMEQVFKSDDPIKNLNTFVIDSTYFTSAAIDYKLVTSLRSLCYEFKGITIFDVYQNIAVVVNQKNSHWFLVLVKREQQQELYQMKFHILDSMSGYPKKYYDTCQKIFDLMTFHLELGDNYRFDYQNNIIVEDVQQQNDGSSCGDHTCYFLYQIFNGKNYKEKNRQQVGEMRGMIYKLIFG